MKFLDSKRAKIIAKIILIVCIFLSIAYTNGKTRNVTFLESLVSKLLYIPQGIVIYASNAISQNDVFFQNAEEIKLENESLKTQIKELNDKLIDYEMVKEENKTLKLDKDTSDTYESYNVIISNVISSSHSNWEEILVIDKGSEDGIKPEMPVITKDGLVGYVISTDKSSSKILSIIDATSTISARASITREEVLVKGNNDLKSEGIVVATDIPIGVEFQSGDFFETSGLGGIYPKGIKIGQVTTFNKKSNPLENTAYIKTSVDFNKIERVAIIESYKEVKNEEIVD